MNSFLDIKARQPSAFGAGPTVYLNSWLNKFIAETDEQIVGLLASSQAMALLPSGFFFRCLYTQNIFVSRHLTSTHPP